MLKNIGIVILILALPVLFGLYQLGMFSFFAPKVRNVERKIFKETRSYNEGKIQQLAKYRLEYQSADPQTQEVLKSMNERYCDKCMAIYKEKQ